MKETNLIKRIAMFLGFKQYCTCFHVGYYIYTGSKALLIAFLIECKFVKWIEF